MHGHMNIKFISRSFLLRMRNVSDKFEKNVKTFFVQYFFLNHAVYEIMWKNTVDSDMRQMAIWRKSITC
jgi:hypothetical protein